MTAPNEQWSPLNLKIQSALICPVLRYIGATHLHAVRAGGALSVDITIQDAVLLVLQGGGSCPFLTEMHLQCRDLIGHILYTREETVSHPPG